VARPPIRSFWKAQLLSLALTYTTPMTVAQYEADICELKTLMNGSFAGSFRVTGFRLSHAQKSLSVVLKHLWCMGQIAEPPACPIDRIVLAKVAADPLPSWTKANSLGEHQMMFGLIQAAARGEKQSVAQWELVTF
jgi:hypothetical protein